MIPRQSKLTVLSPLVLFLSSAWLLLFCIVIAKGKSASKTNKPVGTLTNEERQKAERAKPDFVVEAPTRELTPYDFLRSVIQEGAPVEGVVLYDTGVQADPENIALHTFKKTSHTYLVLRGISKSLSSQLKNAVG